MSKWWRFAVAALFIGYAILLFRNTSLAAGGPDESGYMNEARMFAAGKLRLEVEPLRTLHLDDSWLEVFTPIGFRPASGRWIVPSYPPGLPLHLLVAGHYVSPLLALGCLVLTLAVGRELGLSEPQAIAASAILAVTPQFLMFSLQVMSDVPATFWALLTIWLALRAGSPRVIPGREDGERSPEQVLKRFVAPGPGDPSLTLGMTLFAVAAGVAFAIGVAVRPTNALIAIPLVFAMRSRIPLLLRAAAGAAPPIVALMWLQNAMYGSPFSTGHGTVLGLATIGDFSEKLLFYSFWMGRTLSPLIAPLGLIVIFDRHVDKWHRLLLTSWYLLFLFSYGFWQLLGEWWYTRYLLPATPPIIIAALLALRDFVPQRAIAALLIAVMIFVPWQLASDYRVLRIDDDQKVYTGSMKWSGALIPNDAMVVSGVLSGAFLLYQNRFTARWDRLDANRFEVLRGRAKWYAVLSAVEVQMPEFERRLPGRWTPVSTFRDVTLYRLDE